MENFEEAHSFLEDGLRTVCYFGEEEKWILTVGKVGAIEMHDG